MKTLFVLCPNGTDGTSIYRGMGPLTHLKRTARTWDQSLNIVMADAANWAILAGCDGVFLQRPYNDAHMNMVKLCQSNRKPIWVDYDDNLFLVPTDNPTHHVYSKENNQKNVAMILAMADLVTVSTRKLARDFDPIRQKAGKPPCEVIPNALNELLFTSKERSEPRNPLAFWRGSNTHDRDLMVHRDQIEKVAGLHQKITLTFIGEPTWMFQEGLPKNVMFCEPVDPIEYFQVIDRIRPKLGFVPLADNQFNHCKSNIAWLEATYAGAACLVPHWEEWKVPGAITYANVKDFALMFDAALRNEIDCKRLAEESWQFVQECLTLRTVNEKRRSILDRLFAINL